ncbi:M24 family metallopeptidase [Agromyces archimandritae]|uniref:M24 family metallopeptidase n=1 Tax=Agromyces archimandritae TaxID=2781962 RepID=A0A975IPP6_9MICO|nr:Xaa-Pro peptidase family protein [Agromyces archimandritae]QTX05858.1 M24 family metallopeptidase [Agromyces archimandritae]
MTTITDPGEAAEPTEYRERRRRAAAEAAARGLAALIVTDPANLYYLTGYNAWSFYVPQAMLIAADDASTLLVLRGMDAHGAHRTAELDREEIVGYPEWAVHRPELHPFDWVADELRRRGWAARLAGGTVGIDTDADHFSVRSYHALQGGLPEWNLTGDRGLVNWQRVVKSDAEIALMRKAGLIASNAMRVAADAIAAGVPQHEAAAAIAHAQASGVDGADGDYPAIMPLLATGEAADTPHLTWSARRFVEGESVTVELAGVHRRYHAPLARTVAVGRVPAAVEELAAITAEGLTRTIEAIAPGRTSGDVAEVYWRFLERHGLAKESRLGYSIGIGFPPDWGERTVSIRRGDDTVLRPNMTFHVIAGMWLDGIGCEFSESLRVAEHGAELFTDAPRELIRRPAGSGGLRAV